VKNSALVHPVHLFGQKWLEKAALSIFHHRILVCHFSQDCNIAQCEPNLRWTYVDVLA
jgi:hypothetical protein